MATPRTVGHSLKDIGIGPSTDPFTGHCNIPTKRSEKYDSEIQLQDDRVELSLKKELFCSQRDGFRPSLGVQDVIWSIELEKTGECANGQRVAIEVSITLESAFATRKLVVMKRTARQGYISKLVEHERSESINLQRNTGHW